MSKTKIQCHKCENWFSVKGGNHKKHISACDGKYLPFVKSECCKYCSLTFDGMASSQRANHSRWCSKNPKREQYANTHSKCEQMQTPEAAAKRREGIKKAHAEGKYTDVAKKASAASSAHAMPSGSRGSPSRTLSQVTNDLIGAANQTVKAVVKAIVPPKRAKPVDATVRLPKQLTPFAGWPTDPTDKDIQDVVTARKMFSTDLG